jgi:hypothetical protein
MEKRVTAGARVTVTVEVTGCGTWGTDCRIDQVHRQAAEEAIGYIRNRTERDRRLRIIGEPKVTMVTSTEE